MIAGIFGMMKDKCGLVIQAPISEFKNFESLEVKGQKFLTNQTKSVIEQLSSMSKDKPNESNQQL